MYVYLVAYECTEPEDERVLGPAHDIFGRERFADDREDMGGIGYACAARACFPVCLC